MNDQQLLDAIFRVPRHKWTCELGTLKAGRLTVQRTRAGKSVFIVSITEDAGVLVNSDSLCKWVEGMYQFITDQEDQARAAKRSATIESIVYYAGYNL